MAIKYKKLLKTKIKAKNSLLVDKESNDTSDSDTENVTSIKNSAIPLMYYDGVSLCTINNLQMKDEGCHKTL